MFLVLLMVLTTGCFAKDPLSGPIPKCDELLSKQRKPYVEMAYKRCDEARTMMEKLNSVGCGIKDKHLQCLAISASSQPITLESEKKQ